MSYEIKLSDGHRLMTETPPIENEDQFNKVLQERREMRAKVAILDLSEDEVLKFAGLHYRIGEYKAKQKVF